MKILIPASEGKAKVIKTSNLKFEDTNFIFQESVQQVVDLLKLIEDEDIKSIYGTSQEKSESFHSQNQSIFNEKCVPAINRYTGVVYENIGWENISKKFPSSFENKISSTSLVPSKIWLFIA